MLCNYVSSIDWFFFFRCGLSGEVTWALDTLNILLFDEQTVVYLGLAHMPGLLDTLLEHWRRGLINMFGICEDLEPDEEDHHQQQHSSYCQPNKRVKVRQRARRAKRWLVA